jgi:nicotinate-nucleotide pyrophosphorylase (carboxylating)
MLNPMHKLSQDEIRLLVRRALEEDLGPGDATSLATVPAEAHARAVIIAREAAVIAGLEFAALAFTELDPAVQIECTASDGQHVATATRLMSVAGSARAILSAERVALNFVQRLSGVATLTAKFVEAVKGTHSRILDTRKTTPGLRRAEKYAVACGGGQNHRFGLFDLVLIKDNHLAALREATPSAIAAAVARARHDYPQLKVEVEADTLEQVGQALAAGADLILLDNMNVEELRRSVELVGRHAKTEASGGVNLLTVRPIAETGVDFISVGALTHSAPAVDIGLDFEL